MEKQRSCSVQWAFFDTVFEDACCLYMIFIKQLEDKIDTFIHHYASM